VSVYCRRKVYILAPHPVVVNRRSAERFAFRSSTNRCARFPSRS